MFYAITVVHHALLSKPFNQWFTVLTAFGEGPGVLAVWKKNVCENCDFGEKNIYTWGQELFLQYSENNF